MLTSFGTDFMRCTRTSSSKIDSGFSLSSLSFCPRAVRQMFLRGCRREGWLTRLSGEATTVIHSLTILIYLESRNCTIDTILQWNRVTLLHSLDNMLLSGYLRLLGFYASLFLLSNIICICLNFIAFCLHISLFRWAVVQATVYFPSSTPSG